MKIQPRWICFTLLAIAQITLALLAVVFLFSWFHRATADVVRSQAMDNAMATATQVADQISCRNLRSIVGSGSRSQLDVERLNKMLEQVEIANDGFVCIVDTKSGAVIAGKNYPESALPETSGRHSFGESVGRDGTASPVNEIFEATTNRVEATGTIVLGQQQWWVAARRLPQLSAVLVVTHNCKTAMSHSTHMFVTGRSFALSIGALLGMIAIVAPIIGLFYYDSHLRTLNDGLERQVTHNERELVRTRNAVIFGLAKLAESRDNDTGEHLERIRKYVEILCSDLATQFDHIDSEFIHNISLASSLHDIGKVGIPDSILLKPGRLTPEERSMMQIHTLIGGECLDAIHARLGDNPFMHMARQIAYYHHERWDGEGYPHKLTAEEIPLVARIVAVADVYDALTSKRPYKRAMDHLESRTIILSGSGTQFDPEVIAAFVRHEDKFEAISRGQQMLSDEEATSRFALLHDQAKAETV